MSLPPLSSAGLLPPGIHKTTLQEMEIRFATNAHRRDLYDKFVQGANRLFSAGATHLWVDGSYVTDKEHPNDIDCMWEPGLNMEWDHLDDFLDHGLIKRRYGMDLYMNGIEGGTGLPWTDFFQQTRDGQLKGILVLHVADYAT